MSSVRVKRKGKERKKEETHWLKKGTSPLRHTCSIANHDNILTGGSKACTNGSVCKTIYAVCNSVLHV
eukprot:429835-Pelagomonas_calceolata.AAC.7